MGGQSPAGREGCAEIEVRKQGVCFLNGRDPDLAGGSDMRVRKKESQVRVSLDQDLRALHLSCLADGSHKRSLNKEE